MPVKQFQIMRLPNYVNVIKPKLQITLSFLCAFCIVDFRRIVKDFPQFRFFKTDRNYLYDFLR